MFCKDLAKPSVLKNILLLLEDIAEHRQEHFVVLTLKNNNEVIKKHIVFIGTVNTAIVHPREIFACALEDSAVSIIVAHNHPSSDPTPSRQIRRRRNSLWRQVKFWLSCWRIILLSGAMVTLVSRIASFSERKSTLPTIC